MPDSKIRRHWSDEDVREIVWQELQSARHVEKLRAMANDAINDRFRASKPAPFDFDQAYESDTVSNSDPRPWWRRLFRSK